MASSDSDLIWVAVHESDGRLLAAPFGSAAEIDDLYPYEDHLCPKQVTRAEARAMTERDDTRRAIDRAPATGHPDNYSCADPDCPQCTNCPADAYSSAGVTDERLLWLLRRAVDEWGGLGVALAAATFTDRDALLSWLRPERDATRVAVATAANLQVDNERLRRERMEASTRAGRAERELTEALNHGLKMEGDANRLERERNEALATAERLEREHDELRHRAERAEARPASEPMMTMRGLACPTCRQPWMGEADHA